MPWRRADLDPLVDSDETIRLHENPEPVPMSTNASSLPSNSIMTSTWRIVAGYGMMVAVNDRNAVLEVISYGLGLVGAPQRGGKSRGGQRRCCQG